MEQSTGALIEITKAEKFLSNNIVTLCTGMNHESN